MQEYSPTRRTLLTAIGTGLASSLLGAEAKAEWHDESRYVLVQDESCVPVQPIHGLRPVDRFYDYQLPQRYVADANGATVGNVEYASAGTTHLQRSQTSIAFLYEGPGGLSLVFVHGSVEASDAGSVTFQFSGLAEDGEWIVKDDLYRNPDTGELARSNYDRWQVEGTDHRIDWTWGSAGTDGGVFRGLGDDFEVVVDPAFNEEAALYNQYYEGKVTDWEFLSGSANAVERISLDFDQPIRITTGRCEGESKNAGQQTRRQADKEKSKSKQKADTEDQKEKKRKKKKEQEKKEREKEKKEREKERKEEKKERKEEKKERKEEKKERKEEKKEREKERKEEKEEREEEKEEGDYDDDEDEDDEDDDEDDD